jgi:hypothetical protein
VDVAGGRSLIRDELIDVYNQLKEKKKKKKKRGRARCGAFFDDCVYM